MILQNRKHGEVLALLRTYPQGAECLQLAEALGLGLHSVLNALKDLENMHLVRRIKTRKSDTWFAEEETVLSRYLDSLRSFEAARRRQTEAQHA